MDKDQNTCLFESNSNLAFYNENGIAKARFELSDEKLSKCPKCGGTMYYQFKKDNYWMTAPCAAARARKRVDLYNLSEIPAKFRNATFDNFDIASLRGTGVTIESTFIRQVRDFTRGQRGVLLEGGPGTGKTHLLCAAARYLTIDLGQSVRYVDFSILLSKIRGLYQSPNPVQSEADLIMDIVSVPILFLDELGKGRDRNNEFEMRIIDEIINRRYNDDNLTTYFASNYKDRNASGYNLYRDNGISSPGSTEWLTFAQNKCHTKDMKIIEKFTMSALEIMKRDHLEDRLAPRIVSRISEMANPIVIEAPDRRTFVCS